MQGSRVAKRIIKELEGIENNPIEGVSITSESPAELWKIKFQGPKVINLISFNFL